MFDLFLKVDKPAAAAVIFFLSGTMFGAMLDMLTDR